MTDNVKNRIGLSSNRFIPLVYNAPMIQVGWWLYIDAVSLREITLGFNDVALRHGWVIKWV